MVKSSIRLFTAPSKIKIVIHKNIFKELRSNTHLTTISTGISHNIPGFEVRKYPTRDDTKFEAAV